MVAALSIRDNPDLIQKIWGRYLHDERKYDAWGGQGKLLVLQEILTEEGFNIQQLVRLGVQFQKLVNLVFPRTFFSSQTRVSSLNITEIVLEYYRNVKLELSLQEIDEQKVESLAIEETASKFDISIEQVRIIVKPEYS
jgi:hypothetical protein